MNKNQNVTPLGIRKAPKKCHVLFEWPLAFMLIHWAYIGLRLWLKGWGVKKNKVNKRFSKDFEWRIYTKFQHKFRIQVFRIQVFRVQFSGIGFSGIGFSGIGFSGIGFSRIGSSGSTKEKVGTAHRMVVG